MDDSFHATKRILGRVCASFVSVIGIPTVLLPLIGLEREWIRVFRAVLEAFGSDEPPFGRIPVGEAGVALVIAVHAGKIEAVGNGQSFGIDLGAADDENLFVGRKERQCLVERMDDLATRDLNFAACNDHIAAVGQRTAERFAGLAAHDDRMSRRQRLETAQVFGNVPQQRIPVADYAVFRNGNDNGNHGAR